MHQLALGWKTVPYIEAKSLLFDDTKLSMVMDENIVSFTEMDVLHLIHHLFLSSITSLQCQPTTSEFIHPVDMESLALPTTTVHCTLSEYATRY